MAYEKAEFYLFFISLSLISITLFGLFYLISSFPEYFSGFFFGMLAYTMIDLYLKKDL